MYFTKVNGDAGTGKTHDLAATAAQMIKNGYKVLVVAPTNKAAKVLMDRLKNIDVDVGTYHSKLYEFKKDTSRTVVVREAAITPEGKFERDEHDNIIFIEKHEHPYVRAPRQLHEPTVIFVDESTMVEAEFWHDLINQKFGDLVEEAFAYGDEKQLPPVEDLDDVAEDHKDYYRWWHRQPADKRLEINHRQKGDLSDFIGLCVKSLFHTPYSRGRLPENVSFGESFSVPVHHLINDDEGLEIMLSYMLKSDIIVVPTNKLRKLANTVTRLQLAKSTGAFYNRLPVEGDKIIFRTGKRDGHSIVKNTYGVIKAVHEYDKKHTTMICTFELEDGRIIEKHPVDYSQCVETNYQNKTRDKDGSFQQIDFGYAVTAHSSQGGQWENVVVLDTNDTFEVSRSIRYVSVTRASKNLWCFTHFSKGESDIDHGPRLLKAATAR